MTDPRLPYRRRRRTAQIHKIRRERLGDNMENKESGKSRFNFIDALIILTVLAIIGVIVYMTALGGGKISGTEKTVVYTLKISGVNSDYLPLISEGDKATDSSTGKEIGTIQSVRSVPTQYVGDTVITDSSGNKTVSVSEYDNLYDVYVTLYVTAEIDEKGIAHAGSSKILVGSRFYFRDATFASTAFCTEFSIE